MAQDHALCKGHRCMVGQQQGEQSAALGTAGSRGCRAGPVAAVCPTVSQVQRQNPWYTSLYTSGTRSSVLKNRLLLSLLLKHTHAAAHRPRSQTDTREEERKGEKRQQYIKCFFFNETNPKDVQSGSRCAVHKHGRNKQTEGQSSNRRS